MELNSQMYRYMEELELGPVLIDNVSGAQRLAYVHQIQRGLVSFDILLCRYHITGAGREELDRLRNPPDLRAQLLADIAHHDAQAAAKRAELAALATPERGALTDAGNAYLERLSEQSSVARKRETFGTFPDTAFPDESVDDYLI